MTVYAITDNRENRDCAYLSSNYPDLGLGLLTLLLHYFCLYLHFCYFLPVVV